MINKLYLFGIIVLLICPFLVFSHDDGNIRYFHSSFTRINYDIQLKLRQSSTWQGFITRHPGWWVQFDERSKMPHRAYGNPVPLKMDLPLEQAVKVFIRDELGGFGIDNDELQLQAFTENEKLKYLHFKQYHQGLEVLYSQITFRITKQNAVSMFGIAYFPIKDLDPVPSIGSSRAAQLATSGIAGTVTDVTVQPELKILPLPRSFTYEYALVYEAMVEVVFENGLPGRYLTYIDAHSGEILYRQNRIHTFTPPAVEVALEGTVTDNPNFPTHVSGLPYAAVVIGGNTYYTDDQGNLNLPSLNGPVNASFALSGKYCEVFVGATGNVQSTFTATLNTGTNTVSFDGQAANTEIAAYYHVNQIHDHMKQYAPSGFTSMDVPMETRVDRTDGDCNAFYDGGINFYAPGNGCPATALFHDVIYHEYGHGINYELYNYLGGFFGNSALGEGYADVWAFSLTEDPVLGLGFQGSTNTWVRRYDIDPKVYPEDLVGESHADGEIIAGAWWDLYQNLGSMPQMMDIFIGTHYAILSEPDGNEGQLYTDILLEALMYDDNDANLSNGTPNGMAIVDAFAKHGITLISNAQLTHQEVDAAQHLQPVNIDATLTIDANSLSFFDAVKVYYRTDDTAQWQSITMTNISGNDYRAAIPPQPAGTIIRYFVAMEDVFGNRALTLPPKADDDNPNIPYFILVGYEMKAVEDFDNNFGNWQVNPFGTDQATTGQWTFAVPVPSYEDPATQSGQVQTGADHTTGNGVCAVTGNAGLFDGIGQNDVDDGETTLISPAFNLTNFTDPVFTYYRWYINDPPTGANPANDYWKVFISGDGATWKRVERTNVSDKSWRKFAVRVRDYITPTNNVQLMFIAEDSVILNQGLQFNGGSIVEAALDDLMLYDLADTSTTPPDTTDTTSTFIAKPLSGFGVVLHPNPAGNQLTLSFQKDICQPVELTVYNTIGEPLMRKTVSSGGQPAILQVGHLSQGLYILKASCKTQSVVKRFLVIPR